MSATPLQNDIDGHSIPMSRPSEADASSTSSAEVVGTTQLFDGATMHFVPIPTSDPRDPLNLPNWRKWAAVTALAFFGALALASEFIIGALVPVFMLEYNGIDPRILGNVDLQALTGGAGGGVQADPFEILAKLGGPPMWYVSMLSSLPLLMNGIASFILVPLSIAVGRRPVLLFVGVVTCMCGLWASRSTSLSSHLGARAFQGMGAGAVEALIPLVVQDMMFIHQRNKAIALISAGQGLFIVSLGIASPIIVHRLTWRWIYYLTAGAGSLAWLLLFFLVPESRYFRSDAELAGKAVHPLHPDEHRPRLDLKKYAPRTWRHDIKAFSVPRAWARARRSVWDTVRTSIFPNIIWVVLVNSTFVASQGAAGQVASSVLIAAGWDFESLGIAVVPIVIASPFVWFFGGYLADKISNWHARARGGGRREPEAHLISLVLPLLCGIVGPLLFGYSADNIDTVPIMVLLVAIFFIGFSFLTANAVFSVYLVESYPSYAGPVLVNVSSLRLIIGFGLSFKATSWLEDLGFLNSMAVYSGVLGLLTLGLPLVYFYGKRIRAFTGGKLDGTYSNKDDEGNGFARPPSDVEMVHVPVGKNEVE